MRRVGALTAKLGIELWWFCLFKDQMNVTLQISMAALLAYAGTRTSFAVCDKLYGAFIARNGPQCEGRPPRSSVANELEGALMWFW
jgi:hypothetical protein